MTLPRFFRNLIKDEVPSLTSEEASSLSLIGSKKKNVTKELLKTVYSRIHEVALFNSKEYLLIDDCNRYSADTIAALKSDLLNNGYTIVFETTDVLLISWKKK